MINIKNHLVHSSDSLKNALEKLNKVPNNLTLFVLDEHETLVGTLTDGDVRRGIIKGISIENTVEKFMAGDFAYLKSHDYSISEIKIIKDRGVKLLPVLDANKKITRVIDFNQVKTILPLDAVLMAGGRGERLRPLTDKIPKPLLKIGNKPILEHNIDWVMRFGIVDFTITIRYLGEKIIEYFQNGESKGVSIKYVKEDLPLGTIGAVGLIKEFKSDDVLILNSDIYTNIDYEDFYQTYSSEKADIGIATIPYNVDVPYAVLNIQSDPIVKGLNEKPRYTLYANAGIYIIKKKLLKKIPDTIKTDATDFIIRMIESGYKVVRYPIIGYWIDIGKPEDYDKACEIEKHIVKL